MNRKTTLDIAILNYYIQDELGSPLRVSGYRKKEGSFIGRSEYLTYRYDEFGNDLGKELNEAGIPNPYNRQGAEQPFGYTGYRFDDISGTYFAQAREYQQRNGRFTAEDVIKGNSIILKSLNQYSYCWTNPLSYVDLDGRSVAVAVLVVVGLYKDHSYETPWAMQPGMFCNKYNEKNYYRSLHDEELFISIVKEDADKLGLEFQEYKAGLTGGYIVAIAIDPDPELPDYHFYRENGDGTWSCKRGHKEEDMCDER